MYTRDFLCCAVLCRHGSCDRPIPRPRNPSKCLKGFIIWVVNSEYKEVTGPNRSIVGQTEEYLYNPASLADDNLHISRHCIRHSVISNPSNLSTKVWEFFGIRVRRTAKMSGNNEDGIQGELLSRRCTPSKLYTA